MAPLVAHVMVRHFPDTVSWRWMFGSQMVVVVLFAGFLLRLPPSPRWLAERDRAQWDSEIERDFSPGGPGAKLLDRRFGGLVHIGLIHPSIRSGIASVNGSSA